LASIAKIGDFGIVSSVFCNHDFGSSITTRNKQ